MISEAVSITYDSAHEKVALIVPNASIVWSLGRILVSFVFCIDATPPFAVFLYKLVSGRRLENSHVSIHFRFGNFKRAFRAVSISFFQTAI